MESSANALKMWFANQVKFKQNSKMILIDNRKVWDNKKNHQLTDLAALARQINEQKWMAPNTGETYFDNSELVLR